MEEPQQPNPGQIPPTPASQPQTSPIGQSQPGEIWKSEKVRPTKNQIATILFAINFFGVMTMPTIIAALETPVLVNAVFFLPFLSVVVAIGIGVYYFSKGDSQRGKNYVYGAILSIVYPLLVLFVLAFIFWAMCAISGGF